MSYTDLRDFTAEHTHTDDNGLTVQVEKLGGGTVGREYTGTWRYIATDSDGNEVARGQDCDTGMPHSHDHVAREIAAYYGPE